MKKNIYYHFPELKLCFLNFSSSWHWFRCYVSHRHLLWRTWRKNRCPFIFILFVVVDSSGSRIKGKLFATISYHMESNGNLMINDGFNHYKNESMVLWWLMSFFFKLVSVLSNKNCADFNCLLCSFWVKLACRCCCRRRLLFWQTKVTSVLPVRQWLDNESVSCVSVRKTRPRSTETERAL